MVRSVRAVMDGLTERVGRSAGGRSRPGVTSPPAPSVLAHSDDSSDCPCLQHLDALWFVAWMSFKDRDRADEAVMAAAASAHDNPAFRAAGPPQSWAILIRKLDEIAPPRVTTSAQRQAIALVVNGRSAGDAAMILGVGRGDIHHHLREGLHRLGQSAG